VAYVPPKKKLQPESSSRKSGARSSTGSCAHIGNWHRLAGAITHVVRAHAKAALAVNPNDPLASRLLSA